jgi:hypothetical protein
VRPYLEEKKKKLKQKRVRHGSVVEYLPSKHKALSSTPNTARKKKSPVAHENHSHITLFGLSYFK